MHVLNGGHGHPQLAPRLGAHAVPTRAHVHIPSLRGGDGLAYPPGGWHVTEGHQRLPVRNIPGQQTAAQDHDHAAVGTAWLIYSLAVDIKESNR